MRPGRAKGFESIFESTLGTSSGFRPLQALPFLHVFAADGVARAGQLAGNVDFEFLDAKDAMVLADRQDRRYAELVDALKPADDVPDCDGRAGAGSFTFIAI